VPRLNIMGIKGTVINVIIAIPTNDKAPPVVVKMAPIGLTFD